MFQLLECRLMPARDPHFYLNLGAPGFVIRRHHERCPAYARGFVHRRAIANGAVFLPPCVQDLFTAS